MSDKKKRKRLMFNLIYIGAAVTVSYSPINLAISIRFTCAVLFNFSDILLWKSFDPPDLMQYTGVKGTHSGQTIF